MSDEPHRFRPAFLTGLSRGLATAWLLTRIMAPHSAGVAVLEWTGGLAWLGRRVAPAMGLFGLPGEAAVALVSGYLVGCYGAIATAATIELNPTQVTVLALMVLTAHNLIVESTVQGRSGASGVRMALLRIGSSAVLGALLWQALRHGAPGAAAARVHATGASPGLAAFASAWLTGVAWLLIKVYAIVLSLTIGTGLMRAYGWFEDISRSLRPVMRFLGLADGVSMLWLTATILGLAYSAALLIDESREPGRFERGELLDLHVSVALSHALLEDTLLFLAIGASLPWILLPRPIAAAVAVRAARRARGARRA